MNQTKIGNFIATKRKAKKLTQTELAEILGVSDRTIGNWENGRNMPDLSLLKPLCQELDITINELLSGKSLTSEEYPQKSEENLVKTLNYTNQKLSNKNKIIASLFFFFGLLLILSAITIFPSESSWGSIYSLIGLLISLIGLIIYFHHHRLIFKLVLSFSYLFLFMGVLLSLDYLNVKLNKEAPRFSCLTTTIDSTIYYNTLFYDVVRCHKNSPDETWHIIKNQKYDDNYIMNYCN